MILVSNPIKAQDNVIILSEDLKIKRISENAFLHISYYDLQNYKHIPANGLILTHNNKAYIIDTPWTEKETRILIEWLEDSLKVEIEGIIVTHWHIDCMGGLNEIHEHKIVSYSNQITAEIAKSKNLPVPQHSFKDSLKIQKDDLIIFCKYLGAGHTIDNIVVWIPNERILFGGCLVKALRWKGLGYTGDADIAQWPITLQKVLAAFPECQIVIPGHGDYGDLSLIHHTLDLLNNRKE
jgi:metallo-beta-lactamase class B